MKKKTWIDVHEGEKFGGIIDCCEQCKDCMFRTIILIDGVKCERYKNVSCELYFGEATGFKPEEIMRGKAECELYEKGEPVPQVWIPQNYTSPHNRD